MKKDFTFRVASLEPIPKGRPERRRNSERLLTDYMQERLEIWEDQQLTRRPGATPGRAAIAKKTLWTSFVGIDRRDPCN